MPVLDWVLVEEVDGGVRVVYDLNVKAVDTLSALDDVWLFEVVVVDRGGSLRRFGVSVNADELLGEEGFIWDPARGARANFSAECFTFEGDLTTAWYPETSLSDRDLDVPITAAVSAGAHQLETGVQVRQE